MQKYNLVSHKYITVALSAIALYLAVHLFNTAIAETSEEKEKNTGTFQNGPPNQTSSRENARLKTDLNLLKSFSSELASMKVEMYEMRERSKIWDLEYFPPEEHDKIENLLFRYLMIRESLWDLVNYYRDYGEHFNTPETQTKGFLIGYSAGLQLFAKSSLLVATFINEPAGKSKLNESYPRSNIPAGTYDMLFSNVTSVEHLEAIKVAWLLFTDEITDTNSSLHKIYNTNPEYHSVIDQIGTLYEETEERVAYILKKKSLLFPNTTNRLRHTVIAQTAKEMKGVLGSNLYAIRSLLFTNVSDIKMPTTKPLTFSQSQKDLVHSLLRPGDIILTYTSGYMSNVFLPGLFKHGITYIGTPAQRQQIGLPDDPSDIIKGIDIKKLMENFSRAYLDSGHRADIIEAVAEGVIFNSLDLLMDTHINRMVVLRPRLTEEEKKEALLIVFSLLGTDYDFKFDFNDGSYQCCTEVIYRALNSRGTCNFTLVKRMGTLTLSADDILDYHFSVQRPPFDIVLYAEKTPFSKDNKAAVYRENAGLKRLKKLMKEAKSKS